MAWNIDMPGTSYFCLDKRTCPLSGANVFDVSDPEFTAFVNEAKAQPLIAIDTETTGLVIWKDLPLYFSLAWGGKRATLHAALLPYFAEIFADPSKGWVMANAKYDTHMLANAGALLAGKLIDTQVMHALLYEEKPHNLKYMANHLLGWTWADFQDQFGKIGKLQSAEGIIRRAEQENFQLLVEYAANDAWGTWHVYQELKQQLERAPTHSLFRDKPPYIETLWDLFAKVEVLYTRVLWKMERKGIKVDRQKLEEARPQAVAELQRIERELARITGRVLNPKSTKHLREYFFDEKKVNAIKWSKGGKTGVRNPSVDERFLEHYKHELPEAALLLEHRQYSKLLGTYIEGLHELLDPNDRVHTRLNQDTVRTGRLSSSEPNIQNIPRPENDKWNLRGAFIPEPGNVILAADYEQLEMRLLAAAALDRDMLGIFERGWDIHMGNAALMYDLPYDDIVAAKDVEKKVKGGKLPESAMTSYVRHCLDARAAAKAIGFGQPNSQAEVKPAQNGEAYRLAA